MHSAEEMLNASGLLEGSPDSTPGVEAAGDFDEAAVLFRTRSKRDFCDDHHGLTMRCSGIGVDLLAPSPLPLLLLASFAPPLP